jgi:TPR repeat protein
VSKLFLGLLYSELSNQWYLDAATRGSAAAQRIIGDSYYIPSASASERSHGLNAFRWYSLAAAQGDAEAQFNLGLMYYNGETVSPDVNMALELWACAAEHGLEIAKLTLETIVLDD